MFLPAMCEGSIFFTSLPILGIVSVFGSSSKCVGLILVLMFISPMTYDDKLLFVCLLVIQIFFLMKCLFKTLAQLKIGLFVLLLNLLALTVWVCLFVWGQND